jgi:hypothetical protein
MEEIVWIIKLTKEVGKTNLSEEHMLIKKGRITLRFTKKGLFQRTLKIQQERGLITGEPVLKCCPSSEQILRSMTIKAEALEKGSTQRF